jgi:signal transduction histidine kinase
MLPEQQVNILLVDDRRENLLALEAILSPLGHNIVKASSGDDALKALLNDDFAVILLDVQMPGIDGFETAELIRGRKRSQDIPIIFLTAINTSDSHIFRGYALGAVDYLLKPIVPEILLSKVAVFVDLYKKTDKIQRQASELAATVQELEHQIVEREHTERALRQARDELEERVRERTAGLAAANQALRAEIVERQRAEQERARMLVREQRARAEAEAAVRVRDQFLSIASHELKTPLTTLLGNIQLIRRRAAREGGMGERNEHLIAVVAQQAERLKRMIEALLDITRIQHGRLTIASQTLDLRALAQRVVEEIQPLHNQHRVEIASYDAPLLISGDELRLEQVLQNIIQNAVKYSPAGGTIVVRVEASGDQARVSIADQGIGIPADDLPQLFQRFYRAGNVDALHISGMGVGLYVVREIVQLHQGVVEVASTEGEGSTFTVCLPRLDQTAVPGELIEAC